MGIVGQQPVVLTSGKRRVYKVFGLVKFFTGQFFFHGITDKFNSESYAAFLIQVLEQTTAPCSSSKMVPVIIHPRLPTCSSPHMPTD